MSRRKGELTRADLKRKWLYHVALAVEKVRGVESIVHRFANARSARRTYSLHRDNRDFVVFCFTKPEDAQAFADRFGGERLSGTRPAAGIDSIPGHPVGDQEHAAGRRVCLLRVDLNLGSHAALGPRAIAADRSGGRGP
jgi:hypothetical protein